MREWPLDAPQGSMQPDDIEKFLRSRIVDSQVSLVGELELNSPSEYAGINWTLLELADYLIERPIIKSTLTKNLYGRWPFPATIAIWTVGHAQSAKDGTELWSLDGYATSQKTKLAETFSKSIVELQLDSFERELAGAQKHLMLARIHAMLPDFALENYLNIIRKAVTYHRPPEVALDEILVSPGISKGIQKLFHAMPQLGLDLVKRSIETVHYGTEIGLPSRLTDFLLENRERYIRSRALSVAQLPVVKFDEQACEIGFIGTSGWVFTNEKDQEINIESVSPESIYVSREDIDSYKILDTSEGYLLFDENFALITSGTLPERGGFIVWHSSIVLSEKTLMESAWPLYSWNDWSYSYIEGLDSLTLTKFDGTTRTLSVRKSLRLVENKAKFLADFRGNPIFFDWPELLPGQLAYATDNESGEQHEFDTIGGPIQLGAGGQFDISVSGGLGKSKRFKGLAIPGLKINGLNTPLLFGEKRLITFDFPIGWNVVYPEPPAPSRSIELPVEILEGLDLTFLKVEDPEGDVHFIDVQLPLLTWSVEIAKEATLASSELKIPLERKQEVTALVIHNLEDYVPKLMIANREPGGAVQVLSGNPRGSDARYDLRRLADLGADEEVELRITWNYQELKLASLRKRESNKVTRHKYRTVSLSDLSNAVIEAGIIEVDDWNSFVMESKRESDFLRSRSRLHRGK